MCSLLLFEVAYFVQHNMRGFYSTDSRQCVCKLPALFSAEFFP